MGKKYNYTIKGVCYSRGNNGQKYYEYYKKDILKLKTLNANTIRTYRPLAAYDKKDNIDYKKTTQILNAFDKSGIKVAVGFDSNQDIKQDHIKNI